MIWPGLIRAALAAASIHPAYRVLNEVRPMAAAVMLIATFAHEALSDEEIERIEAIRVALGHVEAPC